MQFFGDDREFCIRTGENQIFIMNDAYTGNISIEQNALGGADVKIEMRVQEIFVYNGADAVDAKRKLAQSVIIRLLETLSSR